MSEEAPRVDSERQSSPGWDAARRLVRAGTVGTAALAVILWAGVAVPFLDAAFLAVLLLLLPVLASAQLAALEGELPPRMGMYLSSGVSIAVLGAVSLALGWRDPGLAAMGLLPFVPAWGAAWSGALTALAVGMVLAVRAVTRRLGIRESRLVWEILPRTAREKGVFAGLSFVAGFGEELAFRGFAMAWLGEILGSIWWAALLTSLAFGFLHAYQGAVGVLRTGTLGLVYAVSVAWTGNLWPAILSHTAVDLILGLGLGRRLVDPPLELLDPPR